PVLPTLSVITSTLLLSLLFFLLLLLLPPRPTLFPYTTLFRSRPSHQTSPSSRSATLVKMVLPHRVSTAVALVLGLVPGATPKKPDRKSTRLNSSHVKISYAVFCLKKKT